MNKDNNSSSSVLCSRRNHSSLVSKVLMRVRSVLLRDQEVSVQMSEVRFAQRERPDLCRTTPKIIQAPMINVDNKRKDKTSQVHNITKKESGNECKMNESEEGEQTCHRH